MRFFFFFFFFFGCVLIVFVFVFLFFTSFVIFVVLLEVSWWFLGDLLFKES